MKKIFLCLMLTMLLFPLVGCQKKVDIKDAMSEITYIYFQTENEEINASICVGKREDEYIIDGKHGKVKDFSLISLKFLKQQLSNEIEVDLLVNGKENKVSLNLNPANHNYMADLGYALNADDVLVLKVGDKELSFDNLSKNFGVNYEKAISIGVEEMGNSLKSYYKKGSFEGECYLKVLTLKNYEKEELFWVFTVVGKDKQQKNVVISVSDGTVIIKN